MKRSRYIFWLPFLLLGFAFTPLWSQDVPGSAELEKGLVAGKAGDDIQALKWFRKASALGNSDADKQIGDFAFAGRGDFRYQDLPSEQRVQKYDQNRVEAVKWYRKSAEEGNPDAAVKLGQDYGNGGLGVTQNTEEAKKWIQKALDEGSKDAACEMGMLYKNQLHDDQAAFQWFLKGDCYFMIGLYYDTGQAGRKDDQEAAKWWKKAGMQGDQNAQRCYENVAGTEHWPSDKPGEFEVREVLQELNSADPNWSKVKNGLQAAIQAGNSFAQGLLADYDGCTGSFRKRKETPDIPQAIHEFEDWIDRMKGSREGGLRDLQSFLRDDKDRLDSAQKRQIEGWLQGLAQKGDLDAAQVLAEGYEGGGPFSKNIELAKKYYALAEIPGTKYTGRFNALRLQMNGSPITVQGRVRGGIGSIGGETTGWVINLDQPVTFGEKKVITQLEVGSKKLSKDLEGEPLRIIGTLRWFHGVEVGDRMVVDAYQIEPQEPLPEGQVYSKDKVRMTFLPQTTLAQIDWTLSPLGTYEETPGENDGSGNLGYTVRLTYGMTVEEAAERFNGGGPVLSTLKVPEEKGEDSGGNASVTPSPTDEHPSDIPATLVGSIWKGVENGPYPGQLIHLYSFLKFGKTYVMMALLHPNIGTVQVNDFVKLTGILHIPEGAFPKAVFKTDSVEVFDKEGQHLVDSLTRAGKYAPDLVLVKFKDNIPSSTVKTLLSELGTGTHRDPQRRSFRIKLKKGMMVKAALKRLVNDTSVESAGPSYLDQKS
jgi:TPR repeat protein